MPSSYNHPNARPHPRISIAPSAARPASPAAPSAWSPYAFELDSPTARDVNAEGDGRDMFLSPNTPLDPRLSVPARPRSRAASAYELDAAPVFPEARVYRLDAEEGLRRFQSGELPESDREWYRLVPPEAREALGKKEVHRQSVLFEIIKTEADYVDSLRLVSEVYIQPLVNSEPPIIPRERLRGFIKEVFYNLDEILAHHQRMLGDLFQRQREQHPLLQSISDIILDTCLLFQNEYETYIKHYPLSEGRHRSELRRNQEYDYFIRQASRDPKTYKRDLMDFISRPIIRLPRLKLLLEQVLKYTELDHPDQETIPLILGILTDFIKSTEPGIEAAEGKVKFWSLCESLVYFKGEIVDMDLYDESRSLIHQGTLARRQRTEVDWSGWNDLFVALLDNYLLLTKEELRNGTVRHLIMSRPIPLEYLRLGSFNSPPESRKERSEEGGILEALKPTYRSVYPFTVYHASSKSSRRYTLYADSEASRRKWHAALIDALAVRKARQEANMWYAPVTLDDGSFRVISPRIPYNSGTKFTGKVTAAASFVSMGRKYLAVGCATGIYLAPVAKAGTAGAFRKVLACFNPTSVVALQDFNQFIIHHESTLWSYSLDMIVRVSQGQASPQGLEASRQKVCGDKGNVVLFRVAIFNQRTIVFYAVRTLLLQTTLHTVEVVDPGVNITPRRHNPSVEALSFRPIYESLSIPKDTHDVTPLAKTLAVCTDKNILIYDPKTHAYGNLPVITLKQRCDAARPLGIIRCSSQELLVVYDDLGCYITRHGEPGRRAGFLRWETRATSFAYRGDHILLFSSQFVEIRDIHTGRLVQVIEGSDIRLVYTGYKRSDPILVVMRGTKDDAEGTSEKIVDLTPTAEIETPGQAPTLANREIWDEWDMI
ncbi:hypothetical protein GLOTRDRAFT_116750 [Gloeophyllum trabeum ATCC 11539]|uniref:Dbl homology domain-containing protein n=1 Tax=Gloeophyllum trabeum (strain ATCC 11539 / FP-39264 / Madison 617) TaxID=670483 RepID=S7Q246_GLOTA|nr:uncharacterized protein GLOTRDRAFT_116750 [Gloeophyllum trabeum ATCC 11539]EPQ54101.1 hypothetical protein GLOTRDRAFT_116750 [Gloeophyllum trabeum ATCC 11539]